MVNYNYNLCSSQRNGDYSKWKWFDYCLYWAISISRKKSVNSVYGGLNNVKLDQKSVENWCFDICVNVME